MTSATSVNTNAPPSAVSMDATSASSAPSGVVGFSPDMILAYCATQMNDLNGQIDTLVNQQNGQIKDQKVLSDLQTKLGELSSPPKQEELQQAAQDFNDSIAQLTPGSPACNDLQNQLGAFQQMCGVPSTPSSNQAVAQRVADNLLQESPKQTMADMTTGKPPTSDQWTHLLDGLKSIGSNISSNAQIQFLQLQQLCSQQQSAVEQATNMLSKIDQTLLDQAKAG